MDDMNSDGPTEDRYPLLLAQHAAFRACQMRPGQPITVRLCRRVVGPLDASALLDAIDSVQQRHMALRLRFGQSAVGNPWQEVSEKLATVDCHDLGDVSVERFDQYVRRTMREHATKPWSLSSEPMRSRLVRHSDTEHALVITFQLAAVDGSSIALVENDIWRTYGLFIGLDQQVDDSPQRSLLDVVMSEAQRLSSQDSRERHLDHWRRVIDGAPFAYQATPEPGELDRKQDSSDATSEIIVLNRRTAERFGGAARSFGCSPFELTLAHFAAALFELSDQDEMLIAASISSRRPRLDAGVVGCFTRMIPFRFRRPRDDFGSFVMTVRSQVLRGLAHMDVDLDRLLEWQTKYQIARGVPPEWPITLVYRRSNGLRVSRTVGDLRVDPYGGMTRDQGGFGAAGFGLFVTDAPDGLRLSLPVTRRLSPPFAESLLSRLTPRFEAPERISLGAKPRPMVASQRLWLRSSDDEHVRVLEIDADLIEQAIRSFPGVSDAQVRVLRVHERDRVVAAVTSDEPISAARLRTHCFRWLYTSPRFVVPERFEIVAPPLQHRAGTSCMQPEHARTQSLMDLIRQELPDVTLDDNYWVAGGTLGGLMRIVRAAQSSKVPVSLDHFATHRSIGEIAERLDYSASLPTASAPDR